MPIPDLTEDGLLPPGVHDCTLDEIRVHFTGFLWGTRRRELFRRLEQYLNNAKDTKVRWVAVDGSFTTKKEEPSDIDMVVVLPHDHDFSAQIGPFEYAVVTRKRINKDYSEALDTKVVAEGDDSYMHYMNFFQHTRDGVPKGILRVRL